MRKNKNERDILILIAQDRIQAYSRDGVPGGKCQGPGADFADGRPGKSPKQWEGRGGMRDAPESGALFGILERPAGRRFPKAAEKGYNLVAIRYKVVPVKDRPVLVYF